MDMKTLAKAGAGGVGTLLVALSVILSSLGTTTTINGGYTVEESTSQTKTFIAEEIENVPNATFYDLVLETEEGVEVIGKSNFGGVGVVSANVVFNPIDNLSIVVYDSNLNEIGVGDIEKDGVIKYEIKEEMTTNGTD